MAEVNPSDDLSRRERILRAAIGLFKERGYAGTSTLAIASAAKVSKRDVYAAFPGKREIMAACVQLRASQFQAPLDLPAPRNRDELVGVLIRYGIGLRLGVTDPQVIAGFRLVLQEAGSSPEMAQTLRAEGRIASFRAVEGLMAAARDQGLLGPGPVDLMARQFLALLVGDLILQHLLGTAPPETEALAREHAKQATVALLRLYPV